MRRFEFKEGGPSNFREVTASESTLTMPFGSGGRLYFFIREQDLKAGNFSKGWVNEQ